MRRGSSSTGSAQSTYSSQCAVGVTGSSYALASENRWLDISTPAPWASAAARIQSVTVDAGLRWTHLPTLP